LNRNEKKIFKYTIEKMFDASFRFNLIIKLFIRKI